MTENQTYKVGGMTCGGCVRSVERALQTALPGVAVQVVLEPGAVTVSGEHEAAAVEKAIEDAGFDFLGTAGP